MNSERVHTLDDLDTWRFDGAALAVVGHPVAHSISPPMHNAALAELAASRPEFARWRYFKFDIEPAMLGRALPQFHARGFFGLNLTIPHKVIAVDLVRRIDPAAAEAGAVNTLRRTADGFEGFNTDGFGIRRGLVEDLGLEIQDAAIVLLGSGGAARGAAVEFLRARCRALWIGNRTALNLARLVAVLEPIAATHGVVLRSFDLARPPAGLPPDALVVNATSLGLKADDPLPIDLSVLPGKPRVYDMIYNPPETPLLRAAAARGLAAAGGLSMLVHQGARALELWTGRPVSAPTMHRACLAALGRSAAAPATGFPASGGTN